MSESRENAGPAFGAVHEVRGTFADSATLERAVGKLETAGFDRADLSLPEMSAPAERSTPESGARPVHDDMDARQARTLHTSGAAAAVGIAAAGVVIGTGGAAAPAVAAAVLGAGLAGGAAYTISSAANQSEQQDRDLSAASGTLVLSVRALTPEKRSEAEAILRANGASNVELL